MRLLVYQIKPYDGRPGPVSSHVTLLRVTCRPCARLIKVSSKIYRSLVAMPARTNKHLSKKQRQEPGEPVITRKAAHNLVNALIEQGDCTDLPRAVAILQKINDHMGKPQRVVLCSNCAGKIGVKRCSGCPDTAEARYCSRECQQAAWPSHKAHCGACEIIDVE